MWLQRAGLVHVIRQLSAPRLPLAAYESQAAFKLYALDTGLMTALAGLDVRAVIEGDRLFTEFRGALAEQYAAQEIIATSGRVPHYWTSGPGGAEVDFVAQIGNNVIPIEVKAERNLRAKSLRIYRDKYDPPLALRASLAPFGAGAGLIDLPLYSIGRLARIVRQA
jgi:predicted AAA+ superfamily ATPase